MNINEKEVLVILRKEDLLEAIEEGLRKHFPMQKKEIEEIPAVGNYISQKEAMNLLNRKTTWFHNKRKSGELPGIKSGNSWWYQMSDIENFILNGSRSNDN